jgi:YihY family inner membrane protein
MRTLPQRGPVRLARRVLEKAGVDDAGTLSAALTYQALLSLIPVVLLGVSVVGFVFSSNPERAEELIDAIAGAVPGLEEAVGNSIDALVASRLEAGILALIGLVWTGSSLAASGSHALAKVFAVPERRWQTKRLWSLVELALLGALALGAIALSVLLPAGTDTGWGIAATLAAAVVDFWMFLVVYVVLTPPGGPPWRGHVPGAIVMAVAWTLLKLVGGWYVAFVVVRASAVYGTIGAVIGLLAILSIASRAFVYGAELSAIRRPTRPPVTRDAGPTARSTG